jgi:hypothetical protein
MPTGFGIGVGHYWKEGVHRSSAPETLAANYRFCQ